MGRRILTPYEALAVAAFDGKPYRGKARPGTKGVDFSVHVTGTLTINPDYEQLFVTTKDLERLLNTCLVRLKGARLEELVAETWEREIDSGDLGSRLRLEIGKHKDRTTCKGQVRGSLQFERL